MLLTFLTSVVLVAAQTSDQTSPIPAPTAQTPTIPNTQGPCDNLPLGSGPSVPGSDQAFTASSILSNIAQQAQTPSGWTLVYQDLTAATTTYALQGLDTLTSYDPSTCANKCLSIPNCKSFNIFFERDPMMNPAAACTNPPSTTNIKCAYWGIDITPETTTYTGAIQETFHIAIAGSNGYTLAEPSYELPGYTSTFTNDSTINAPTDCGSYITYKAHNSGPYDPNLCATDCAAQAQETNPFNGLTCHFFTSYELLQNGLVQAQICALYSRAWDPSYATNTGYTYNSNTYTIANAFSWSNDADPGTNTCPQGKVSPCKAKRRSLGR